MDLDSERTGFKLEMLLVVILWLPFFIDNTEVQLYRKTLPSYHGLTLLTSHSYSSSGQQHR